MDRSKPFVVTAKSFAPQDAAQNEPVAMETPSATGRGYLQVGADSPQDVVDAVAGDKGHEDVLQETEKLLGEIPHIPSPFPAGRGQAETSCP